MLGGTALGWMGGLIIARLFREKSQAQRHADRRTLSAAYLSIMNGSGVAKALLEPFQHRSRLMAETLLMVLGLVRGAERERLIAALVDAGVDQRFRARLTRGSRAGRLAAVEALAAFPSLQTRDRLRALHKGSNDAEMRITTVRALIDIGDRPRAQDLIANLIGRGDNDSLLYAPVLQRLAIDAPDDALAAMVLPGLRAAARAVMVDAVGASGNYRALPTLSRMATAPDLVLRMAAVRALGMLGHPSSTDTIAIALQDEAWDVRAEAAEAAGKIGGSTLVPLLVTLMDDPVWWVRFRASDALARMGNRGVEALRLASDSPIDVTRRSASLALAELELA